MRMPSCLGALGMVVFSLAAFPAMAATMSASFGVSATVETKCLVSSPVQSYTNLNSAMAGAPSSLSVSCNFNSPYTLILNNGASSGKPLPVAERDVKDLPMYGSLSQKPNKSTIYLPEYRNPPVPPTDLPLAKEPRHDSREARTDTIVLEVTY